MDNQNLFLNMLPTLITAFVSIIAMVVSYMSTRKSTKQSYNNNIYSMRFAQKEKVADQIAEKAAILLTKCDPSVLNTVINELVPRQISHEENANIRRYLLGIADEIQTYSNVIKMLSHSILDSKEMLSKLEKVWTEMDTTNQICSDMLLKLVNIYTAMTPEGVIKSINIMEETMKLERTFSETYKDIYCQLHQSMTDLLWYIRNQSIPEASSTKRILKRLLLKRKTFKRKKAISKNCKKLQKRQRYKGY